MTSRKAKKRENVTASPLEDACARAFAEKLWREGATVTLIPDTMTPFAMVCPPGFWELMQKNLPKYGLKFKAFTIGVKPKLKGIKVLNG